MTDHSNVSNDVSTVSAVSKPSDDGTSSADTVRTPRAVKCPLGHEEDPNTGGSDEVKDPDRPGFATHWMKTQYGQPGLYFHGRRQPKGEHGPEPLDVWICGPLECLTGTRDERNNSHGLLLYFKPLHGSCREWAMPKRLLKGSGEELRGELLDMGLRINPEAHRLLNRYLNLCQPEKCVTAATCVGWHNLEDGRAFVLPCQTIANDKVASRITFQSEFATQDDYATAGTLKGWRQHIGKLCSGNPLLVLAVSTALAGPLLEITHRQAVGNHFYGDSSSGKTSLLEVAASVWSGPEFKRTWRATSNGLEGIAAAQSDTALILDEIGEADGREVGAIIYALANGTGKGRAGRSGAARRSRRWRIAILSSGERTLAAHMSEAGRKPKAGQSVRLLDIPAKRRYGVFDDMHHMQDGRVFADHLKNEVTRHYGHLGPAFIKRLVNEEGDLAGEVDRFAKLPGFHTDHPMQGRAAKSLALIALAGELATRYGLTGWKKGEALGAAIEAFKAWKADQGGGQSEHEQILSSVQGFIERHGDARFSALGNDTAQVRDRAGWWRDDPRGRVYLFHGEGLKEALGGFDVRRGLESLEAAGWIVERDGDKRSVRIQRNSQRKRLYAIRLSDGEEAQA